MKLQLETYLALGPGYYGLGATAKSAYQQLRDAGYRRVKPVVLYRVQWAEERFAQAALDNGHTGIVMASGRPKVSVGCAGDVSYPNGCSAVVIERDRKAV